MFPDSILTTENKNIIKDVSYTNSIHKIYVCTMDHVEDVKTQEDFSSFDEFYRYASKYSLFDEYDLKYWYNRGGCKTIKLTYNGALKRRIVRHDLIENVGLARNQYWGFFELTNEQFDRIAQIGGISKIIKQ